MLASRDRPAPPQPPASLRQTGLLLAVWALLVLASLGVSIERIQRQSHALLQEGSRNVFRTIVAARAWNAASGGVYVPVSEANPPNPHLNPARREVHTREGLVLTQINPAYMTRLIANEAARDGELRVHMTGLRVLRPENTADAWERRSLLRFEQGEREIAEVVEGSEGRRLFRYMAALLIEESCLECHTHQAYKVGDVRGGISISQPYSSANIRSQILHSAGLHALVFLLLAGVSLLALRALQRRWAQTEQAMNSLMQTEKMASMGRLVAGFAHELNTPLGVAIGALSHSELCLENFTRMLQREEVAASEIQALLADMHESNRLTQANLRRAASLVSGFKRSSIDIEREDVRSFAVRPLVEDLLQTLTNTYRNKARIEFDCPAGLKMTSVPGLLDQILTNLILNSVTHAFGPERQDGQIRIGIDTDGADTLLISFADDGVGMPPEVLQRIFEPFFTTRPHQGGSGLGLYICYSLVTERLGGTIRCDSLPGGGSHFLIRLPLHSPFVGEEEAP